MTRRQGSALAIDHGERRCGFAVADALRIAVTPLAAHELRPGGVALLDHIAALLEERVVGVFVVLMPFNMDGSEGARAKSVRDFAASLATRFPQIEIAYVDERLSTKAAEELMRDAGVPPRDRKALKDSFAALAMLRDWIAAGEP